MVADSYIVNTQEEKAGRPKVQGHLGYKMRYQRKYSY